jgi:hypothetical protein
LKISKRRYGAGRSDCRRGRMLSAEAAALSPADTIVPATWFAFMAGWTVRCGLRTNDYTSLITIQARRDLAGSSVDLASAGLLELARVTAQTIRATDLIGELPDEGLGILVADADEDAGCRFVQRIAEALATVHFSTGLTFTLGVAVSPTHGIDVPALIAHAESHPTLNVHGLSPASDDPA